MRFDDRRDAGRRLGARLQQLLGAGDGPVVVLGLPRGGVVVASEVAEALGAPLDVILVRKLGVPFQPELAMGAIGEEGARVIDEGVVKSVGVSQRVFAEVEERERRELERRAARFRGDRAPASLEGRTAVVVDDGVATGSTARAACAAARARGAAKVVLAVPVASPGWEARIGPAADACVALATPRPFFAIGQFYEDFSQTTDDEVAALLARPRRTPAGVPAFDEDVTVELDGVSLPGRLSVPAGAAGLVVFSHGSGSSHRSPRNGFVAGMLQQERLGTLLFDLLTAAEERHRENVFDVGLLAGRLSAATSWLRSWSGGRFASLPMGYFGASTGAAGALWAAAEPGSGIAAVVSRGGRPDLAGDRLGAVTAPTLLIVGSLDHLVLQLNAEALGRLGCEARLEVVEGATHLFEEPGTLERAAGLARDWFVSHLAQA